MSRGRKSKAIAHPTPVMVSASIERVPTLAGAPYVRPFPLKASVCVLRDDRYVQAAVMLYVPSAIRRLPLAPADKALTGADKRTGAGAFIAPCQSYAQTRLHSDGLRVRPMWAVIGKGRMLACFPRSAGKSRSNGATSAVAGIKSLLPPIDTYTYGNAPLIPFNGYLGALPLVRPDTYPRHSADGEAIRMPYPRKGETARYAY